MEPLMSVITLWLSLTFGLPAVSDYPQVRFLPSHQMSALHSSAAAGEHTILGTYDPRTKVYMRQPRNCGRLTQQVSSSREGAP